MTRKEIRVARVAHFDTRSPGPQVITLEDGTSLKLASTDVQTPTWTSMIEHAQTWKRPIYVEFDADQGTVTRILLTAVHVVEFVAEQPEGERLAVALRLAPSLYFANTSRPGFDSLEDLLRASLAGEVELVVTVDDDTLEIIDARRP